MSKSNVENVIRKAIELLDDIDHALRNNNYEKLKSLCRDADDHARSLERARQEMHSYWKD